MKIVPIFQTDDDILAIQKSEWQQFKTENNIQ